MGPILLPLVIAGVGVLASIIGTFLVRISNNEAKEAQVQKALDRGNWVSIILTHCCKFWFHDRWMLPETMQMNFFGEGLRDVTSMNVFYAACIGLSSWCFNL